MNHAGAARRKRSYKVRASLIAPLVIPALVFALTIIFDDNAFEDSGGWDMFGLVFGFGVRND